jgi:ribosome-associated protein
MNSDSRIPRVAENEVELRFVRASGPGGQNVNKVATAVELRFHIGSSKSLTEDVKSRLRKLAGRRVSDQDVLVIDAQRFRSQEANRRDALARLGDLVRAAAHRPRSRIATKPTAASRRRRVEGKRVRAAVKRLRGKVSDAE